MLTKEESATRANGVRVELQLAPSVEVTCEDCPHNGDGDCEWAWDLYNTNGDCLAMK